MSAPINSRGKPISVDEKCFALAELFMRDCPEAKATDVADLAEDIQRACEDATSAVLARSAKP